MQWRNFNFSKGISSFFGQKLFKISLNSLLVFLVPLTLSSINLLLHLLCFFLLSFREVRQRKFLQLYKGTHYLLFSMYLSNCLLYSYLLLNFMSNFYLVLLGILITERYILGLNTPSKSKRCQKSHTGKNSTVTNTIVQSKAISLLFLHSDAIHYMWLQLDFFSGLLFVCLFVFRFYLK